MNLNDKVRGYHMTYGCADKSFYSLGSFPIVDTSVAPIINLFFEVSPPEKKSTLIGFYFDPSILAGEYAT